MKRYSIAYIFIAMFLSVSVKGQELGARAQLDTNTILIGDQVRFGLQLTAPIKSKVFWPMLEDTLVNKVEILRSSPIDTLSKTDETFTLGQELVITSFDSGEYVLPPIPFKFVREDDTTSFYAQTRPITLQVETLPADIKKDIKPIKPPLNAPVTLRELLPWLLGIVGLGLIIAGIVYYIRKRKKDEPVFTLFQKPPLPPYEIAMRDLETLKDKKIWQSGRVKEYHSELTDIIRTYLEGQFGIGAMEMTTDEIMAALTKAGKFDKKSRDKLQNVLIMADMVKFAKAKPLPLENDQSMTDCVAFVRETKPDLSLSETEKEKEEKAEEKITAE